MLDPWGGPGRHLNIFIKMYLSIYVKDRETKTEQQRLSTCCFMPQMPATPRLGQGSSQELHLGLLPGQQEARCLGRGSLAFAGWETEQLGLALALQDGMKES